MAFPSIQIDSTVVGLISTFHLFLTISLLFYLISHKLTFVLSENLAVLSFSHTLPLLLIVFKCHLTYI